jgi:hypothetical protein
VNEVRRPFEPGAGDAINAGSDAQDVPEGSLVWPIPMEERARLALLHEPEASASPDGFRLATCVVCEKPMVAMWHLWLDWTEVASPRFPYDVKIVKEIHMCHACATDIYGAPTPDRVEGSTDTGTDDWMPVHVV